MQGKSLIKFLVWLVATIWAGPFIYILMYVFNDSLSSTFVPTYRFFPLKSQSEKYSLNKKFLTFSITNSFQRVSVEPKNIWFLISITERKNYTNFRICKTNLLDDYSNLHNLRTFCQFGNFHRQLLLGQLLFSMCSFPSFSFRSYCCYFRILHLSLIGKMRVLKTDIFRNQYLSFIKVVRTKE